MKKTVERNLAAGIPLDIQYADIDHFQNNMDFTINEQKFKDLPNYFRELQSRGMHGVPILDPALVIDRGNLNYKPYLSGLSKDVYIKWPQGVLCCEFNKQNKKHDLYKLNFFLKKVYRPIMRK